MTLVATWLAVENGVGFWERGASRNEKENEGGNGFMHTYFLIDGEVTTCATKEPRNAVATAIHHSVVDWVDNSTASTTGTSHCKGRELNMKTSS